MKKIIVILTVFVSFLVCNVFAQYSGTGSNSKTIKVKSYVKKNGGIVKEHRRTERNSYNLDNFKTKYNYNPYTGKTGTTKYKSPYNSLNKTNYKSTYKSNLTKTKTIKPLKIKTYKPKKIKLK